MTLQSKAGRLEGRAVADRYDILHTAEVRASTTSPVKHLKRKLGEGPFALVALFVTPAVDFHGVVAEAEALFPDVDVLACTTAGEIGTTGYEEGLVVAVGFPEDGFATTSLMIHDLDALDIQETVDQITLERIALRDKTPDLNENFAFLVVDGLSLSEDTLAATIAPALRDFPIFGGSAGDGTAFSQTFVALNGEVVSNAAILTLARSKYETRVFSLNHLVPGDTQMVVTGADPARRIVKEINAEPAAREYARLVGKDPDQLDRFTFASHPVVVRIGDTHHVRAIQQVNDQGELVFFSAIDEGMVLTVASQENLSAHLQDKLSDLGRPDAPANIIGCDCILRRIEAEQSQQTRQISDVLSAHRVTGFSTYGEQIGPLHVNHTMSGVAFYHPTVPGKAGV
ncbi:FIST N-terminal domain-containing protein [Tateyamaria sp. ANG-S1]|uniref:FIST N-terminal domain-containing protein n=1 Tax=Tateyamaria sp. ANG-S1 TaxID=1577905 RepID=UPI00057C9CE5|nr:FIST N-terminal domain-containing protein [Tateyamaria sp. ANG-S1]KIC45536.1 GfdT protein [Tateyamaria sp. ANG-S1]